MSTIVRTPAEIERVMNWAFKGKEQGSHFSGMSYEDGIVRAIDWLLGDDEIAPDED